MSHRPIRCIIADSDAVFGAQLSDLLNQQPDIDVVHLTRDGHGAVESCRQHLPDVVLIDLHVPVLDGVRAIQTILAENERIKIIATSAHPNDRHAIEAVKAGASGYIEKNGHVDPSAWLAAIEQVAGGEVVINPALAASILAEFHRLTE